MDLSKRNSAKGKKIKQNKNISRKKGEIKKKEL